MLRHVRTPDCAAGCGASGVTHRFRLDEIAKEDLPGWVYVIAIDGTCYWLCPTCGQKAIAAAKVLFELTGDPEIRIDPLLTQGGVNY